MDNVELVRRQKKFERQQHWDVVRDRAHRLSETMKGRFIQDPETGQLMGSEGGGSAAAGEGKGRPKISEGFGSRAKASTKAMAAVNSAVNAIPAQHAALLQKVNVQVYGHANDVVVNGRVGYTNFYDKSNNTISVAEKFIGIPPPGFLGLQSRTLREFSVAVEHNTAQALGRALDDKLNGAGSSMMTTAQELKQRGVTWRERNAGDNFFGKPKTMFAELYAVAYSPDNSYEKYFGSMTRDRAATIFAPELAKIKKLGM